MMLELLKMHQQQHQQRALDTTVGHPVIGRGKMLGNRPPQAIGAAQLN
jgi:hypothetical protein